MRLLLRAWSGSRAAWLDGCSDHHFHPRNSNSRSTPNAGRWCVFQRSEQPHHSTAARHITHTLALIISHSLGLQEFLGDISEGKSKNTSVGYGKGGDRRKRARPETSTLLHLRLVENSGQRPDIKVPQRCDCCDAALRFYIIIHPPRRNNLRMAYGVAIMGISTTSKARSRPSLSRKSTSSDDEVRPLIYGQAG